MDGEPINFGFFHNEKNFDSVNPRFNVSYFPNEAGMVYLNIAKGFRSGVAMRQNDVENVVLSRVAGVDSIFANGDTVWSYDLGAKWLFLDGRFVAQGAVYLAQWQDLQQQVGVTFERNGQEFTNGSISYNVGDADMLGFEWDLQYRLTDQLTLGFNGAKTDSEYTDVVDDPSVTTKPQLRRGNEVPLVPEWTFAALATYRVRLTDNGWWLSVVGSAAYRTEAITEEGVDAEKPFRRLNLYATAERAPWSVQLFMENATDFTGRFYGGVCRDSWWANTRSANGRFDGPVRARAAELICCWHDIERPPNRFDGFVLCS